MKKILSILSLSVLLLASTGIAQAETSVPQHKVHHLVVVWLKKHGDEAVRKQYIEASKQLAKLPGVLSYNMGTPATIKHEHPSPALDSSYDIAISSTFENQQALEDYAKHSDHKKIIHEVLKPLVEKYKVYDFVE